MNNNRGIAEIVERAAKFGSLVVEVLEDSVRPSQHQRSRVETGNRKDFSGPPAW